MFPYVIVAVHGRRIQKGLGMLKEKEEGLSL